ncbi:MAG: hypothetical protein PHY31_10955, partial [Smithellaceae bacterium]|nr:hypothetical protein [Smithellaceae bacterium]
MQEQQNKKRLTVRLTDGSTIKGFTNIKKYNRLSDFLNAEEEAKFIVLTDASLAGQTTKTIVINRSKIEWV